MMKRLAVSLLAVAALMGGSAYAADAPEFIDEDPIIDNLYDWTGFYAGVHGGWAWVSFDSTSSPATHEMDDVTPLTGDGWVLGGNIGADWQMDSFVFGIEGQANWSNATASFVDPADEEWHAELDWYAALSARFGVAADQALFYGKAGVVVAGLSLTGIDNVDPSNSPTTATNHNFGFLLGAGVEVAVSENVSIFGELEHVRVGASEYDITGTGYHAVEQMSMTANIVKVGIRARM
jgi:outer membrane immunogenic protein